ncbi:2165_t:CDS:2 [Paraglomus occultum]|uniref:2165_t:CDS:1 n=1 Tax=Paraglomus occultum TaxID=144539 RepID=A0A9N9ARN4_9GLOM|nr:2165_t:CDS:2 [Paraglomus occultum]
MSSLGSANNDFESEERGAQQRAHDSNRGIRRGRRRGWRNNRENLTPSARSHAEASSQGQSSNNHLQQSSINTVNGTSKSNNDRNANVNLNDSESVATASLKNVNQEHQTGSEDIKNTTETTPTHTDRPLNQDSHLASTSYTNSRSNNQRGRPNRRTDRSSIAGRRGGPSRTQPREEPFTETSRSGTSMRTGMRGQGRWKRRSEETSSSGVASSSETHCDPSQQTSTNTTTRTIGSSSTSTNNPHAFPRAPRAPRPPRTRRPPRPNASASVSSTTDVLSSITHGLSTSTYECMICCEVIRPSHKTWFCSTCWAVFHLHCAQKWARKSMTDIGSSVSGEINADRNWRCPGCQNRNTDIPTEYKCFCGKSKDPEMNRYITPHSCGDVCGRPRECPHSCVLNKSFEWLFLRRTMWQECTMHSCETSCHAGPCPPCDTIQMQHCYCGKSTREAKCGQGDAVACKDGSAERFGYYACEKLCDRLLACGVHRCESRCHPISAVEPCPRDPSLVTTCPCGKRTIHSLLKRQRVSCQEDIPLCGSSCNKQLPCGHLCQDFCHSGDCKPCEVLTKVKCRCGSMEFERICKDVSSANESLECERICHTLRECGRHECGKRCCPSINKVKVGRRGFNRRANEEIDENHRCTLICGKNLKCGNHTCQILCHRGHCPPCLEASFDELTCACGRTKVYPPISCGMKLPSCPYTCTRSPPCGHSEITHPCHEDGQPCPPCPSLVNKLCMCGKTVVKSVPCHQTTVSCGRICDLPISCGGHRCKRSCHSGNCLIGENGLNGKCAQKCGKIKVCGHECTAECHAPARCPEDVPCETMMVVKCQCGRISKEIKCNATVENAGEIMNRHLGCDEACALAERNRRLAEALEIDSDDTSKIEIEYEENLVNMYSKNKVWAKNLENVIGEFITSDKQTLNLPAMKGPFRKFVHELCGHYRLASESVDVEPYRSVILRKKPESRIPSLLLSQAAISPNQASQSTSTTASVTATSVRKPKQPVNALYLSELSCGLSKEECQKHVEPLMGKLSFVIKWVNENDAYILPSMTAMGMDEVELTLTRLKHALNDGLKGIAQSVELCWVNSKYEVISREKNNVISNAFFEGESKTRVTQATVRDADPIPVGINPFGVLMTVGDHDSTVSDDSSDRVLLSTSNNKSGNDETKNEARTVSPSDDVVDDWELLSDEE